eukprot:3313258-Amphidinium_carterae.1
MDSEGSTLASLPTELTGKEKKLGRLLRQASLLAREVLPIDVSLTEWVSSRLPTLLDEDCVALEWASENLLKPNPYDFFRNLPRDGSFTAREEELRDSLLQELADGPKPLSHFTEDGAWEGVPVAAWIRKRLGRGVVEVYTDGTAKMVRLPLPDPK